MNTDAQHVEMVDRIFLSTIHVVENEDDVRSDGLPWDRALLADGLRMIPGGKLDLKDADLSRMASDCIQRIELGMESGRLHAVCVLDLVLLTALGVCGLKTPLSTTRLLEAVGLHRSWAEVIASKFGGYYPVLRVASFNPEELKDQIAGREPGRK